MARKQSDLGVANPAAQEIWQSLFAKALTLIDEIEKNGTKDLFGRLAAGQF